MTAGTVSGSHFYHGLLDDATEGESATLGYGQRFGDKTGLHRMHSSSMHYVETLSGLAATGVEVR